MITVDDLLAKEAWIEAGANDEERAMRLAVVEEELFPAGLDEAERAAREQVLEAARAEAARRVTAAAASALAGEAEKLPPLPPTPPSSAAAPPPKSPIHEPIRWRSTVEEHGEERAAIRAELDALHAQAKTPFDLVPEDEPRSRRRRGLRP